MARKPHPSNAVATLATVAALAFAGYSAVTTALLVHVSDANKAQQRALVCFNAQGVATMGTDWRECRTVAIREVGQ